MPPLPLQIRLEDYQVVAIDAVRDVRNGGTGLGVRLSRQQVISAMIDYWIAAHTQAPASPPVPPPDWEALDRVVAAVTAAVEPSPETPPVEEAPETTPQQQRVLDVIPSATKAHPAGMPRKDIQRLSGLSEQAVDSALYKLHQRGHIVRVSAGHYVRA